MKKLLLIATITLTTAVSAQAEHQRGIEGLILGAGGGALAGQAIGRNTEATVIGTAVGGVIGYIIGNEINRGHNQVREVVYQAPPQVIHKETRVIHYNAPYKPVNRYRDIRGKCKEAEVLGTINGKPRKIYGTVCRTPQGWKLVSQEPNHYDNIRHDNRDNRNYRGKDKYRHYKPAKKQHWIRHRY